MPRPQHSESARRHCPGGLGFGRRADAHELGRQPDIICYRCKVRLGCSLCLPNYDELICKRCHDWGHPAALRRHGRMLTDPALRADAFRIVMSRYAGTIDDVQAVQLFAELFTMDRR